MGLKISDDELLSMDPTLFFKLQKYLKEFRENKISLSSFKNEDKNNNINDKNSFDYGLLTTNSWISKSNEAVFEEVENKDGKYIGIKITQNGRTYIARNWRINKKLKEIIEISAYFKLTCLWRHNHPLNKYFLSDLKNDYSKGSHHIGFSAKHYYPWVFVVGSESLRRRHGGQTIKTITFNKKYLEQISICLKNNNNSRSLPKKGEFCIQNFGGKDITVLPEDFEKLLKYMYKLDMWKS